MAPSDHAEQAAYLRLVNLPANELANTVMVVKLEFDRDPARLLSYLYTIESLARASAPLFKNSLNAHGRKGIYHF